MIAIDTNILVYAHRPDSAFFEAARRLLTSLAEGKQQWAIPWPCVYEFLRVATHPRLFSPPTPVDVAVAAVENLLMSPSAVVLGEGTAHLAHMNRAISDARATGNFVHDAHIAALLLEHGVKEIYTADRGFRRFRGFKVTDPFE